MEQDRASKGAQVPMQAETLSKVLSQAPWPPFLQRPNTAQLSEFKLPLFFSSVRTETEHKENEMGLETDALRCFENFRVHRSIQ